LVRRALSALPPKLQVVATLALVEELPYTEIAEALDMPVGTVKSRVFRATRALRKELARLGIQS
jgi:RNA polymerase sigma factor (sigma-70 family)